VKTLAERVTYARESAGLSKTALAQALGVTSASITHLENGRNASLKGGAALAIERVTGVSATWLVSGRGPIRKAQDPQSRWIAEKLEKLDPSDRDFVRQMIEKMLRDDE
jgi:transcriptional regulator with XRE-family HTH domain